DAERESGYQDRDRQSLVEALERFDRRYHPDVDKALWMYGLERYMTELGSVRVQALDRALNLPAEWDEGAVSRRLSAVYATTTLDERDARLAWIDRLPADFEASRDPFIRLAVALFDHDIMAEETAKERAGRLLAERPAYMEAIIAWNAERGLPVYPDANSTLRVTYGAVFGGSPADGIIYEPFTRLEGILGKHTGADPFDSPDDLNDLIRAGDYGAYYDAAVGSVPVNYLTNLDSTGGNSGSATLNARGELVGLLFDGTIESVNSDWDFDPRTTRTIHVDSRYMLWLLDHYVGAERLLEEMTIVDAAGRVVE
ncbi:MAG: S46 family peptidase, partial [Maricaulaceae bacterium]